MRLFSGSFIIDFFCSCSIKLNITKHKLMGVTSMRFPLIAASAFCLATTAHATTYTYDFTARFLNIVASDPATTIVDTAAAFSSITGTITLDDTVLSSDSDSSTYAAPIFTVDQFSTSGVQPSSSTLVANGSVDQIASLTDASTSSSDFFDRIDFILRDTTATALSSNDFPTFIDLDDFNIPVLLFYSSSTFARERVDFTITDLTLQTAVVPLPATLPLMMVGLGGLALMRRRQAT